MHAAFLMDKIKDMIPDIQFFGIGGQQMEQRGLKSIVPLKDFSVVGFFEVARRQFCKVGKPQPCITADQ